VAPDAVLIAIGESMAMDEFIVDGMASAPQADVAVVANP
jgi:hypothetical protein